MASPYSDSLPSLDLTRWIDKAIASHTAPRRLSIALNEAMILGQFSQEEAQTMGIAIVFSLADSMGIQRYFFSMDNALLISQKLAKQKAWTAVALKMPTHELAKLIQPGADLYGLQNEPGLCCIGGGLPCWSGDKMLGAIGVSGGSVEQDIAIARNALARFSQRFYSIKTHSTVSV